MKKVIGITAGIIFAIALIVTLFLTSFDIVIYGDMPDWFVSECEKYGCLEQVGISRADMSQVTVEMFEYLRGNVDSIRETKATINGQEDINYFNEKECLHMEDCRKLFSAGYALRRICIYVCIAMLILLVVMFRENISAVLHSLAVGMISGAAGMTVILGIVATMVAGDFYKYFTMFHEIFFDNDLWILDETTDRLLMVMPEQYFIDCVTRIGLIFFGFLVLLIVLSVVRLRYEKHKHHEQGYPYYI